MTQKEMIKAFRSLVKSGSEGLKMSMELATGDVLIRPHPELPKTLPAGRHAVTVWQNPGTREETIIFSDVLEIPEPEAPEEEEEETEEALTPDVELAGKVNSTLIKDRESFYQNMVKIQGAFYERMSALEGEHRDRTERLFRENQKNLEAQNQKLLEMLADMQAQEQPAQGSSATAAAIEAAAKVLLEKFLPTEVAVNE